MSRHPVQIGFAGVATEWLQQLPTLSRHQRMRIAAVYDPTAATGALAAAHWEAAHRRGLLKLLESPQVDAVVIGNAGWMGWQAARLCIERGLATLLVISRLEDQTFFDPRLPTQLQLELAMSFARGRSGLLMPGLPLRWLPATIRARELTATHLGAIESLQIQSGGIPIRSRQAAELLDWGLHLAQSQPTCVEVISQEGRYTLQLKCRRPQKDGNPVVIQLMGLSAPGSPASEGPSLDFQAHAVCRHGEFRLKAPDQIRHIHERAAHDEHLTSDRSTFDVMLDLFGRRLVGGVVPIPDLLDVLKARQLVLAGVQSLEQHEAITVQEDGRTGK